MEMWHLSSGGNLTRLLHALSIKPKSSLSTTLQNNDFEHELRKVLKIAGNALFQINNQMYALWFKDSFYYLFDPYRHKLVGPEVKEDTDTSAKWATVRMFRDVLSMLNVFHQLLRESNPQSPYFIHTVHIRNMAECPQGYALKPVPSEPECDVKSLNETIKFPVELSYCSKELEAVSDYEPDMKSISEDMKCRLDSNKTDNESENFAFSDSELFSSSLRKYKTPAVSSLKFPNSVTELSFRSVISKDQENDTIQINTKVSSRQEKDSKRINKKINSRESSPNHWLPLPSNKPTKMTLNNNQRPTNRTTKEPKPPLKNISPRPVTKESRAKPITPSAQTPKKFNDAGKDLLRKFHQPVKLLSRTIKITSTSGHTIAETEKSNLTYNTSPWKDIVKKEKVSKPECHLFAYIFNEFAKDQDKSQKKRKIYTAPQTVKRSESLPCNGSASGDQSEFRLAGGKKGASCDRSNEPQLNQQKQETKCVSTQLSIEICPQILSSYRSAFETTDEMDEIVYDPIPYPVYLKEPQHIAVVGSESGTMESLDRLLNIAFNVSNRALTMTPWGTYVVFKQLVCKARNEYAFYLFDGCTCNIDRFRHLDLSSGTAGFQSFSTQAEVVCYMIDARETRSSHLLQSHLETTRQLKNELLGRGA